MPRPRFLKPEYCLDKATGRPYVTIDGQKVYLGPRGGYGTQQSRDAYDRVIGEWIANGRRLPPRDDAPGVSAAIVVHAFWKHVEEYHTGPAGKPHPDHYKVVLRVVQRLYPREEDRAAAFGPLALEAVRAEMVKAGWCRSYVNAQVGRAKRMFKRAVGRGLVPAGVWHALQAVEGLKRGRSPAPEGEPVRPVPEAHVTAVVDVVSRQVGAMIQLQVLTGMRPGEVCQMRTCDIDTTGPLWLYRPARHKTGHHGHARTVYLGPRARKIVEGFLKPDTSAYLFSPADAEAERRAALHEERRREGTPLSCGNVPGSNRSAHPKRAPGARYTVSAYRTAIARACDRAFPPPGDLPRAEKLIARWKGTRKGRRLPKTLAAADGQVRAWRAEHRWHPHQLRHNAATRLRKEYGLEAAQVILGHETLSVTEIYAEKSAAAAVRIMSEVG